MWYFTGQADLLELKERLPDDRLAYIELFRQLQFAQHRARRQLSAKDGVFDHVEYVLTSGEVLKGQKVYRCLYGHFRRFPILLSKMPDYYRELFFIDYRYKIQ